MESKEKTIVVQGFAPAVKKLLSFMLAVAMLFTITAGIDLSAYAERIGDYDYEVLDDGTIGILRYYGSESELNIPSVIDDKTVTVIGAGAFYDGYQARNITSITIPDSIVSIGVNAFENTAYYNNKNNWDNGVLYIGNYLVDTNNAVGACDIKDGTVLIADGAFFAADKVTSITIPDSVAYIGELSLNSPYLESIEVDKNNKVFDSRDNCNALIETNTNTLICGCKNTIIPDSVTSIAKEAFSDCTGLISVTIPEGVTSIGDRAFYNCSSLESLEIPEGVTSIGDCAFYNCSGLKSVKIPSNVTEIGEDVFRLCTGLEEVIIENGATLIGQGMFSSCESLTSVTIPGSVKEVKIRAFAECTALQEVTVEKGVQSIGESAFESCDSLKSIRIFGNEINMDSPAFNGCCEITNITMPSRYIKTLRTDNVESITIPDGATVVEEDAFSNFYHLNSVTITIPESITRIENRAFYNCGFANIVIPSNVEYIGDYAFYNCSNMPVDLIIPESVQYIGESAFEGCFDVESIVVPDGVTVGNRAFKNCPHLTNATISADYFDRLDKSILTDITITGTWIEENAFRNLDNLQNVTIANGVTSIGNSAFYNCTNLEEITIPESVTDIGASAFDDCSNLKSITILSKNCHIASRYEYSNISREAIPKSITIYGYYGTPTQAYVRKNGNEFIPIDDTCNHAWNRMEIIEYATCFGEGTMEYTCDWCFSKKTEPIPAKGHTIVTDKAVEPTCTTDGKTEGSHCIAGDAVIVEQKTIPATGHSYDSGKVTKPATCTVNGVKTYTCANCNATKTEAIPATGHKAVTDKAVVATCTKTGLTEGSHCSVCNYKIAEQKTVSAKGHNYKTTTSKATTKKNGSVEKKCSACGATTKTTIYYPKTITLSKTSYVYNGKAQKPTVTVKDSKGKKIAASNYTVKYTSNKNVGSAAVTITFKGNYSGTVKKTFTINPKATTVSKVKATTKAFTVTWKKQSTQTTGYQIQYSTDKNFKKNNKTVTVSKNSTTSKTISKLTAKKKYYVRVRTYKTVKVNGKSTKVYSSWSSSKSVTTKK